MSTLTEFRAKRAKLIAKKHDVDLYISSLPENTEYLSGFFPMGMTSLYSVEVYLVYNPWSQRKILITSAADVPTLIEIGYDGEIFAVGSFQFYTPNNEDPFTKKISTFLETRYPSVGSALVAAVQSFSPNISGIAIDESRMPINTWQQLKTAFPSMTMLLGSPIFREIKYIKHQEEIELLRKSVNITEDAFLAILKNIKPGVSEYDIALDFKREVVAREADVLFCVVTIDERAAFSDTFNQPFQKVENGSVIRFDFGCIYKGFRSDIARTVVVGRNIKAEKCYESILEGEEKAIEAIKPGITAGEIYNVAVSKVQKTLPQFTRHHCGHGIGLASYDLPSITPGNETPLEENMVLCIETPYYEIGWGGVQVEDTVVVTKDGAEYLTKTSRKLIFIEV